MIDRPGTTGGHSGGSRLRNGVDLRVGFTGIVGGPFQSLDLPMQGRVRMIACGKNAGHPCPRKGWRQRAVVEIQTPGIVIEPDQGSDRVS